MWHLFGTDAIPMGFVPVIGGVAAYVLAKVIEPLIAALVESVKEYAKARAVKLAAGKGDAAGDREFEKNLLARIEQLTAENERKDDEADEWREKLRVSELERVKLEGVLERERERAALKLEREGERHKLQLERMQREWRTYIEQEYQIAKTRRQRRTKTPGM